MDTYMPHTSRVAIGQLRVSLHRLEIETVEPQTFPKRSRYGGAYDGIRGTYETLFTGQPTLREIMDSRDQRQHGRFLLEIQSHRDSLLQPTVASHTGGRQSQLTDFFIPQHARALLPSAHTLRGVAFQQDLHWESCIPSNFHKIPLRLNLAWLHTSLFKSKVHTLIQKVLSLEISACMKWESFVEGMQEVIRECGKCFAAALAKGKVEAEQMILCMSTKVDSRKLLSEAEYMRLCDAYRCLQIIENNAIQSSKVRARYTKVNDLHANSKCFFDSLRTKRFKDTITTIETDGLTLHDGNIIAEFCSLHFKKLFAASFAEDDAWFSSLQDSLEFTPQMIDSHMADACEKGITEEEVFLALQSLKNGKAPGIDGITKEFMAAFWPSLKTLVLDVCNEIWRDQRMPYTFKLGKIKLIPKVQVPKRMEDWRPISMMSIIYKIFAKIFALKLKPIMHKITHPLQTGFVYGRSIYDNIFLTQILMEHAISSNQQIVGMQIDFEKAFDRIRWDFIAVVLKKLGFGVKFSRLIYINGRLSNPFPIERSVSQGCLLSQLFYAKINSRCIHGISISGLEQIAVGFADDTFIFAKAEQENVRNIITSLTSFSNASALHINMKKSALIDISANNFHSLCWEGPKIQKGTVFRYLGYPIGVNISTKNKIEWVLNRVRGKMGLWHVAQWPIHARIRIVQAFLQPYVMYYLLLLDWRTSHLHAFECLLKNFLWNKMHSRALVLSTWDYICQPRSTRGLGNLNLLSHLQARRSIENAKLCYKGIWKLDPWNKFFSHAPIQTSLLTLNFVLRSFKMTLSRLNWNGRQRYMGNSFASLSPYWSFLSNPPLAFSLDASARYLNNKGIDSIAKCYDSKWEIFLFPVIRRTFTVGPAYRSKWIQMVRFLQQFQVPLSIDASDPWKDWLLAKHTRWKLKKTPSGWHARYRTLRDSLCSFRMKIFMWRIFTGHFTLGAFLSNHGLQGVRCPHCASHHENMRHTFWMCPTIQRWWNTLFLFPIWDVKPTNSTAPFCFSLREFLSWIGSE
ncbi:hypothetical protein KP509_17G075200 [Ceratopteris richardii]|uniref:Reverse transcriptase domain-containing protein n=1 Tax=Ceratopteris richardii TaxID=49495 RepID=A0A8T2SVG2_CERRI|nr:hypothetical protein KP509_17G075200 [Ceratopteris richardii]